MQLHGATQLEIELHGVLGIWEQQPASEFQTRVSVALSNAVNELQKLRGFWPPTELKHGMNCPALLVGREYTVCDGDGCTCGLRYRISLQAMNSLAVGHGLAKIEMEKERDEYKRRAELWEKLHDVRTLALDSRIRIWCMNLLKDAEGVRAFLPEQQEVVARSLLAVLDGQATDPVADDTADPFTDDAVKVEASFERELESLINRHSKENASNTPDFILAQYIAGCLLAFETAVQQRERWYGRDPRPMCLGGSPEPIKPVE